MISTITSASSSYHHWSCEFESHSWWGALNTTLCDKVCQWLAAGAITKILEKNYVLYILNYARLSNKFRFILTQLHLLVLRQTVKSVLCNLPKEHWKRVTHDRRSLYTGLNTLNRNESGLYLWPFFKFPFSVHFMLINKGNNKIAELRTIFQRESQISSVYKQTKSVNNRKTVKIVMTLTWYRHF
jgi:hypothetical protein